MDQIRVLVTAMPAFFADVVRRILAEQDDIAVVGGDGPDTPVDEAAAGADVVIIGTSGSVHRDGWLRLVWQYPRLRILALDDSGRQSSAVEIGMRRTGGTAWPAALVDLVRLAGRPG